MTSTNTIFGASWRRKVMVSSRQSRNKGGGLASARAIVCMIQEAISVPDYNNHPEGTRCGADIIRSVFSCEAYCAPSDHCLSSAASSIHTLRLLFAAAAWQPATGNSARGRTRGSSAGPKGDGEEGQLAAPD